MCKRGICSGWLYVLCSAKRCRRSHTVSLETGMIIIWAGKWLVPSVRRVVNHARIPAGGLHTGQIRHGQGSAASRDRIAPSRRGSCVLESSARTKGELLRKGDPAPSARKSPSSMLGRCGGTGQIVPVAYLPQGDGSGIDSAPRGHRHASRLQVVA